MKWIFASVALLLATLIAPAQTGKITIDLAPNVQGHGSGTVIWNEGNYSFIVTNKHIGAEFGRMVFTIDGVSYPAGRAAHSPDSDLSLIFVNANLPVAKLATEDPTPGTKVTHKGITSKNARGEVIGQTALDNGAFGGLYSCEQGDSGAALFNEAGEVVGVNFGKTMFTDRPNWALFVPVSKTQLLLVQASTPAFPRLAALKDKFKNWFHKKPVPAPTPIPPKTAVGTPLYQCPNGQCTPCIGPDGRPCIYSQPTCPNGQCPLQKK